MFYVAKVIDLKAFQVAATLQKHNPNHLSIYFPNGISDGIVSDLCFRGALRHFEICRRASAATVTRNTCDIELRKEVSCWRSGVQQEPLGNRILLRRKWPIHNDCLCRNYGRIAYRLGLRDRHISVYYERPSKLREERREAHWWILARWVASVIFEGENYG